MRSQRGRRALATALLRLLFLVSGLLVAEGITRAYLRLAPPPPEARYVHDPEFGYRLSAGPFWDDGRDPDDIVNSLGFRDGEPRAKRDPAERRVLLIGDSFVLGTVSRGENFPEVLEEVSGSEVVSVGMGGWSPVHYAGAVRALLPRLEPDVVVVCLYVGNDVSSIDVRGKVLRGQLYYTGSNHPLRALARRSEMFLVLERAFFTRGGEGAAALVVGRKTEGTREDGDAPGTRAEADRAALAPSYLLTARGQLRVFEKAASPSLERSWRAVEARLGEIGAACRARDVPWILVLLPSELQVDPSVRKQVLDALDRPLDAFDFSAPNRRLESWASTHGVRLVDLLPELRAERVRCYLVNDTHWNRAGHRLAGEALARHIAGAWSDSLGTVPPP